MNPENKKKTVLDPDVRPITDLGAHDILFELYHILKGIEGTSIFIRIITFTQVPKSTISKVYPKYPSILNHNFSSKEYQKSGISKHTKP